jgi:hypothetical protein
MMKRKTKRKKHPPGKDLALAHKIFAWGTPTCGLTKMLQLFNELKI